MTSNEVKILSSAELGKFLAQLEREGVIYKVYTSQDSVGVEYTVSLQGY